MSGVAKAALWRSRERIYGPSHRHLAAGLGYFCPATLQVGESIAGWCCVCVPQVPETLPCWGFRAALEGKDGSDMGLDFAIDALYDTGWSCTEGGQTEQHIDGRSYPAPELVRGTFAEQGYELVIDPVRSSR